MTRKLVAVAKGRESGPITFVAIFGSKPFLVRTCAVVFLASRAFLVLSCPSVYIPLVLVASVDGGSDVPISLMPVPLRILVLLVVPALISAEWVTAQLMHSG